LLPAERLDERLKADVGTASEAPKSAAEDGNDDENLLSEFDCQSNQCLETLSLGEVLIGEIESEENFPPDYLANVQEKVAVLKSQFESVEVKSKKLREFHDYSNCKRKFYVKLSDINQQLETLSQWLQKAKNSVNLDFLDEVEEALEVCSQKRAKLRSLQECDIEDLKRAAGEVTLHPVALSDPSNNVKSELYVCCDSLESLDSRLAQREDRLVKVRKDLSDRLEGANQTDVSVFSSYAGRDSDKDVVHLLQKPIEVDNCEAMEKEICDLQKRVSDGNMRDELKRQVEARIGGLNAKLKQLKQFLGELEGIDHWLKEADLVLNAKEPALDDISAIEEQLKESNGLLDDIFRFKPNVTVLNDAGPRLRQDATPEFAEAVLVPRLKEANENWQRVVEASNAQNKKLRQRLEEAKSLNDDLSELASFVELLEKDLLPYQAEPVTQASEMSQRTTQLQQLLDRIQHKKSCFERVAEKAKKGEYETQQHEPLNKRWNKVVQAVSEKYESMKTAPAEYGEFMAVFAQENAWLERVERKLGKSATVITAADAEEISEEHDEIENFLNNHDDERVSQLEELAKLLGAKNIVISSFEKDVNQLKTRWSQLSQKAKKRLALLEGKTILPSLALFVFCHLKIHCRGLYEQSISASSSSQGFVYLSGSIEEAQEWEYKLIEVQDWLADKDMLLTSHLEQELTVDDLPDESQVGAQCSEISLI
jgi:hypothetical protein